MSRRKHLLQSLEQEIEPPGAGQHIVRAVGSRGSNIIEVEFPDGRKTLCLLPARFHKTLWIKKGNYLIVEDSAEADSRVTGQVAAVLFADQVKQLKRMQGVWPPEFESSSSAAASQAADKLAALGLAESNSEGEASPDRGSADAAQQGAAAARGAAAGAEEPRACEGEESGYSSEDSLPPIPRFNNRKIIEYEVSDTESDD